MSKIICLKTIVLISLISLSLQQADIKINRLNILSHNLAYSGLLPISETSSDTLFFTYYGVRNAQESDLKNYPLIIVVGSPGSSAQFINFAGMGPILLNSDMTTT